MIYVCFLKEIEPRYTPNHHLRLAPEAVGEIEFPLSLRGELDDGFEEIDHPGNPKIKMNVVSFLLSSFRIYVRKS